MSQSHRQTTSLSATLKQKQTTSFTPQQQQAVKILQLSSTALLDEIQRAVETNPFLEQLDSSDALSSSGLSLDAKKSKQAKDTKSASLRKSFSIPDSQPAAISSAHSASSAGSTSSSSSSGNRQDDRTIAETYAANPSLHQSLYEQANTTPLSRIQRCLLNWLIDGVDHRGYLDQSTITELQEQIPTDSASAKKLTDQAIRTLQGFEPTGIGARNLSECLLLQLQANSVEGPTRILAKVIIQFHLEALASGDLALIEKTLSDNAELNKLVNASNIKQAIALIRSFKLYPGEALAESTTQYIRPDIIVEKINTDWHARLDGDLHPALNISAEMSKLMKKAEGQDGYANLQREYANAKSLMQNVQKRGQTLLEVAQLLVDRQQAYFNYGDVRLQPLKLADIAKPLELHESTISRTVNDKYMLTPHGVIELKSLFSAALRTTSGSSISAKATQSLIKTLISEEPITKPLSDSSLVNILNQRGIQIARRTVAKYREQLRIPASHKRK